MTDEANEQGVKADRDFTGVTLLHHRLEKRDRQETKADRCPHFDAAFGRLCCVEDGEGRRWGVLLLR